MHTKPNAVLANSDRLTPEDLMVADGARLVWRLITASAQLMARISATPIRNTIYRLRRKDDRSDPLELLARIIVWLAYAGVSEAQLRTIPLFLTRTIEECFAGAQHRSLDELDLDAQRAIADETALVMERRVVGREAPERLELEATADEREAAIELERARVLHRRSRQCSSRLLHFPSPQPS